jgi:hypothetical protein
MLCQFSDDAYEINDSMLPINNSMLPMGAIEKALRYLPHLPIAPRLTPSLVSQRPVVKHAEQEILKKI